jgi:uncharacterized membrane protein
MNSTRTSPRIEPPALHLTSQTNDASQPEPTAVFQTTQQPSLTLVAIGLAGIGVLGLVYGDFALVWQPVASWFPARATLAYITGALEVVTALGLCFRATSRWAVRTLLPGIFLWQLLKLPDLIAAPTVEASYLSFGETAILLAGAATLFAKLADLAPSSPFAFLTTPRALRLARTYLGLWIIPIGLSHIVYHEATVLLIPAWLPNHLFFAYLTGAGQIASGLGLIFNVLPRPAAYAEAAQLWLYTLLIWVPAVLFGPSADVQAVFGAAQGPRMPLTALLVTWFPAACALAVAQNTPAKSPS